MIQKVILPQLGQTMEEGTIEKWHKQEGDEVAKGDVLFDLTTDKATLEVESFAEGILKKIVVQAGNTVPVNELVAIVGEQGDEIPEDLAELKEEKNAEVKSTEQPDSSSGSEDATTAAGGVLEAVDTEAGAVEQTSGRIFISPRAGKIARESLIGVEALRGKGTGPNGRIIEKDVQHYIAQLGEAKFTPAAKQVAYDEGVDLLTVKASDGHRVNKEDVLKAAEQKSHKPAAGDILELTPMRQTIAERMTMSKQTVPHFYLIGRVNMRTAMEMRKELNESGDVKITVTDLIIRATALALERHPRINCRFQDNKIVLNSEVNIGVAVSVEDGLFVPVIKNVPNKSLSEVSSDLKYLAQSARQGILRPDQYEDGCVTVSNLGTYGVDYFLPIINTPESFILGIGGINEEIIVENGNMHIEPMMKVALSADHRATDGAAAAECFSTFRELLENPEQLK